MRIKSFQALRPKPDTAHLVSSPPYDTVTEEEARALVVGNPWSFMRVVRPEVGLPEGVDPHSEAAYIEAAAALDRLFAAGAVVREDAPSLYIYRQTAGEHSQRGVVACCHVEDYVLGIIRRHERTRADKEEDRVRHILATHAHTGPAFIAYRDDADIDRLVHRIESGEPLLNVQTPDGTWHTVWRVRDTAPFVDAFAEVRTCYIADGHHRTAAAVRAAQDLRRDTPGEANRVESDWMLAVLFPATQLRVLAYNRCVLDLNGHSEAQFLVAVRERFNVVENVEPEPKGPNRVSMYLAGKWYGLSWRPGVEDGAAAELDVGYLQEKLLDPVLGITDPRRSPRIEFFGGAHSVHKMTQRVDARDAAVAFSMYPVTVEQMMAVADRDDVMPPKSTWFEPKLRSGLLIHTF